MYLEIDRVFSFPRWEGHELWPVFHDAQQEMTFLKIKKSATKKEFWGSKVIKLPFYDSDLFAPRCSESRATAISGTEAAQAWEGGVGEFKI